jgi:hypothetical protein
VLGRRPDEVHVDLGGASEADEREVGVTLTEIAALTRAAMRVDIRRPRPTGVPRNSLVLRSRSKPPLNETPGSMEMLPELSDSHALPARRALGRADGEALGRSGGSKVLLAPGAVVMSGTLIER